MAKVGTAHVEIKPVLNEEALAEIAFQIEAAVETAVTRALTTANTRAAAQYGDPGGRSREQIEDILTAAERGNLR